MARALEATRPTVGIGARPLPRRRWQWWERLESISTVGLGLLFLAGALFYVWQHTLVVREGYALERLRVTQANLFQENKALRLEVAQLRSLRRVEKIARTRLGMVTPGPGQVVIMPEASIQ